MRNPIGIVIAASILSITNLQSLQASSSSIGVMEKSGWLVYWDFEGGERTIQSLRGRLDDISIFAYDFNGQGHLVPASEAVPEHSLLWKSRQRAKRPRLWIAVVNDTVEKDSTLFKDPDIVHHVLTDPIAHQSHLQELLDLSKDADGLEIDYENLKGEDRAAFSQFARDLSSQLHARGQLLSIVLEPRTERREQVEGPGAIDWSEIAKSADRIRIMAYFLHYGGGPSGPTAPAHWVDEILVFALKRIPKEKLDIALCLDGIDWAADAKGTEVMFRDSERKRHQTRASVLRSHRGDSPHFVYTDGKDKHQVWYEDAESLREKVHRIQKAGVMRISFWRLGTGDPAFWKWLADQKGKPKLTK